MSKSKVFCLLSSVIGLLSSVLGPAARASQCQAPAIPIPVLCEAGGKFLCLNTPPGGVREDYFLLKGRLNLENSVLGQFSVSTQHEYTKKIKALNVSKTADANCWETSSLQNGELCLEKNGIFSIRVPLEELGPYTLFVTAARLSGEPGQASARISRVMAPTVTVDVISYEPDIASGTVPEGTGQIKVIVDLLKGCQEASEACDFIGAATGGVMVTASNEMEGPPQKKVLCATTTILGGVGRFAIGVPVVPGKNRILVSVCNAATGFEKEKCPTLAGRSFQVGGVVSKVEILNPFASSPFYWEAEGNPSVPLRFKIAGFRQTVCDKSVQVSLNTGSPFPVCPNAAGIYEIVLHPVRGYNAASIIADTGVEKLIETVPFGWGKSLTPFTPQGNLKPEEEWKLKNALELWVPKNWINDFLVEKLNLFFNSDDFKKMMADFADAPNGSKKTNTDSRAMAVRLPAYCQNGGENLKIRLMAPPSFEKISLARLQFEEGRLKLPLSARNMSLKVQVYKDEEGDGKDDVEPLPLKIFFRTVRLTPILEASKKESGGALNIALTSAETDCAYKRKGLCKNMPAILVPERFEGGASSSGAFAVCDRSQRISPKMEDVCHSLNTIDRQTGGVIQEKILDAVNYAYACGGGNVLGALSAEGISLNRELGPLNFSGKISLGDLKIKEGGLTLILDTLFGDNNLFKTWSLNARRRGAGILISSEPTGIAKGRDGAVSMGLRLPLISQIFWGLAGKGGKKLDLVIDQNLFQESLHLDFERDCAVGEEEDANKKKNPLCNVWPRAREILGSSITEYGYLEPQAPLSIKVIPSEAFPLRAGILDENGKVTLEALDWDVEIASATGPIVTAKLSMKITALIGSLPNAVSFKIIGSESGFWLTEKEGGNNTVIPSAVLLDELQQKLRFALDGFSQDGKEILLPIPEFIPMPRDSVFSRLGLKELTWGKEGFQFQMEPQTDRLLLEILPIVIGDVPSEI